MAKTIQLTNIRVLRITIDAVSQSVYAEYVLADDSGHFRKTGTAIFYRTLPNNPVTGQPVEPKEDWIPLPAIRAQQVVDIYQDVVAALTNKLLTNP